MNLPTLQKKKVWHVGSPKSARTRASSSQEGTLLSVSEHPQAWTRIARLGGRETWELVRTDRTPGVFVNMHAIPEATKNALIAASGLVAPVRVYIARWTAGDEYGDDETYEMTFTTRAAAEREIEDFEDAEIREQTGWKATPELNRLWKANFSGRLAASFVGEFALLTVLERMNRYDGAWWNDVLDPYALSAPRGGIFQKRLNEWLAMPARTLPREWRDE